MSQFNYWNDINSAMTMDGELTRCPAPRWQKKLDSSTASLNASANLSKLSISYNNGLTNIGAAIGNKTPQHYQNGQNKGKKTPTGKSPSNFFLNASIFF